MRIQKPGLYSNAESTAYPTLRPAQLFFYAEAYALSLMFTLTTSPVFSLLRLIVLSIYIIYRILSMLN